MSSQYDSAYNCFFGLDEILHEKFQANRKLDALNGSACTLNNILTWAETHLMMCTPTPIIDRKSGKIRSFVQLILRVLQLTRQEGSPCYSALDGLPSSFHE